MNKARNKDSYYRFMYPFIRLLARIVSKIFFRYKTKPISIDGPFILVSNHTTDLDPGIIMHTIKNHMYFVASAFAGTEGAFELNSHIARVGREYHYNSNAFLMAETSIPSLNMRLRCFSPMNSVMQPLLQHNQWVWVLTLLAGLLLTVYLLYYRLYILQPLNFKIPEHRPLGKPALPCNVCNLCFLDSVFKKTVQGLFRNQPDVFLPLFLVRQVMLPPMYLSVELTNIVYTGNKDKSSPGYVHFTFSFYNRYSYSPY